MDVVEMSDIRELMEPREGPCVSICLTTHVSGPDELQDALRLRNLIDRADDQLARGWMRAPVARDWMEPVRSLPLDHDFWEKRNRGLAIYIADGFRKTFRVPIALEELSIVNHRFSVKSLLPLATDEDRYFILALSQKRVELYQATEFHIEEVSVQGLPAGIQEGLDLDGEDRGSQSHMANRWGKGKETSVFHGQGGSKDTHKDELLLYFRMIDEVITKTLRNETAPLILAAVDYLVPIFREVCHYPRLVPVEVRGNADYLTLAELHQKSWELIQPTLCQSREEEVAKFHRFFNTHRATDDLRQALLASYRGRIETLFVPVNRNAWGAIDPEGHVTAIHEERRLGDDDLLDVAAVQTLLHGGRVYAVPYEEMPSAQPLAAVMRY